MNHHLPKRALPFLLLTLIMCCSYQFVWSQITNTGPSTTQSPYLLPTAWGYATVSVFSACDVVNGYKMVGVPDCLGAFDNNDGTFTLLMNHELKVMKVEFAYTVPPVLLFPNGLSPKQILRYKVAVILSGM